MEISKISFFEHFLLKKFPKIKEQISFDFFKYKYVKVKINNKLLMVWQLDRFDFDISYINKIYFIDKLNQKEETIFKKNNINTLKFIYEVKDNNMNNLTSYGFYKKDANIIMTLNLKGKKFPLKHDNVSFRQFIKGKDDRLRCDIQNEVFYETDRIPLSPRDIAYEYNKNFFIEDMAKFITLNGEDIGYGQVLILDGNYTIANLGILKKYQGKGYGKELLRLLLNEAKEMGIDKVLVTILLDNIASQAVAIANGGVVTERTDERVFIWIDTKK